MSNCYSRMALPRYAPRPSETARPHARVAVQGVVTRSPYSRRGFLLASNSEGYCSARIRRHGEARG